MSDDALAGILDVPLAAVTDSPMVGSAVVTDTDLPGLDHPGPLTVVCSGGAGQLAGPVAMVERRGLRLAALEVALRDLDDPAGNARRVVAALDALGSQPPVVVVLPEVEPSPRWLAAADEVAAAELRLGFPASVATAWVEAALDRETPFRIVTPAPVVRLLTGVWRAFDGLGADAEPGPGDLLRARRWLTSVRAESAATATSSASASQV